MDFSDALRAMKRGHKVRRDAWPVDDSGSSYVSLEIARMDGYGPFLVHTCADGRREVELVSNFHMLECDDWELA